MRAAPLGAQSDYWFPVIALPYLRSYIGAILGLPQPEDRKKKALLGFATRIFQKLNIYKYHRKIYRLLSSDV